MTKENFLFSIIGLLLGLIVGFMFANSVNQGGVAANPAGATPMKQNANMPPGHPDIGGQTTPTIAPEELAAAAEKAKAQPEDLDAQLAAAEIYYRAERFEEAIAYLKRANGLQPESADIMVHLGNATFDAGKYEEAEKWYSSALVKKPDNVNVRTDLGLTFIFRTPPDYDRAVKEFTASLAIEPNHVQTLQNLTVAYTKKGDAAKARETLAKLESADAKNPAITKLREEIGKLGGK